MSDNYAIIVCCDLTGSHYGPINCNSFNQEIFVKNGLPKFREVFGRSDWSFLNQFTTFGDKSVDGIAKSLVFFVKRT